MDRHHKTEGKQYDKAIKENIEVVFLLLEEKYPDIKIAKTEDLPYDLQITIERKADYMKYKR